MQVNTILQGNTDFTNFSGSLKVRICSYMLLGWTSWRNNNITMTKTTVHFMLNKSLILIIWISLPYINWSCNRNLRKQKHYRMWYWILVPRHKSQTCKTHETMSL